MAWLRIVPVLSALLCLAGTVPVSERFHKKRQSDRPCIRIATNIGQLLDPVENLLASYLVFDLPDTLSRLLERDMSDQTVREDLACRFEGVTTLSEYLEAVREFRIDYSFLRLLYGYFYFQTNVTSSSVQYYIDYPESWFDLSALTNKQQLLQDMQAFGLTDLDPEVEEFLEPLILRYLQFTSGEIQPTEPSSTLSRQEQCAQLTNDIRLVWNDMIREEQESNPDISVELRAAIRMYTGLDMSDHQTIQGYVCAILELAKSNGLEGVHEWMDNRRIIDYLLKAQYPVWAEGVDHLINMVQEAVAAGNDYSTNNYNNYYYEWYKNRKIRQTLQSEGQRKKRTSPPYYYPGYGSYGNYGGYGGYGGSYGNYGSYYIPEPGYNYNYNYNYNYGMTDTTEVMKLVLEILLDFGEMGLYDLENDINV